MRLPAYAVNRTKRLIKAPKAYWAEYPESLPGLFLHAGEETAWLADGVLAVPWWRVV